ncbi:MAG TPA: four-helix bundle copper-binding protein, partial [Roseimicrobium sp.]|nr:four-helix bundle copper-binding protein [Roseimicrobium sp.]
MQHPTADMQQCIQNCTECHAVCAKMPAHCLKLGGPHAAPEHIGLLIDCAQICATSADFMLRVSPHHAHTCRACSVLCDACAKDCERIAGDDAMMKQCA